VSVGSGGNDGGIEPQTDAGTGATSSGGSGGSSGAGGSGGSAVTGGAGGSGATSSGGSGGASKDAATDAPNTVCDPDPTHACDNCIETKCCQEWLDCTNDADCFGKVAGKSEEYYCVQDCLLGDGGSIQSVEDCAAACAHDSGILSSATNSLIACMRDTGTGDAANRQNCTTECFTREL
jgi:hypothetical protein